MRRLASPWGFADKIMIILGIILVPFIFSCDMGDKCTIRSEVEAELKKTTEKLEKLKKNVKCKLLYTKITKLSAVNINVGCFEKGTDYVHAYILVVESNLSESSADAASTLAKFFRLRKPSPKIKEIHTRTFKAHGKKMGVVVLRLGGVTLDEIMEHPQVILYQDNL